MTKVCWIISATHFIVLFALCNLIKGDCIYNGKSVKNETKWKANDCTVCYCPSDSTQLQCTALGDCEDFQLPEKHAQSGKEKLFKNKLNKSAISNELMLADQASFSEDFFRASEAGGGSGITFSREFYKTVLDGDTVSLEPGDFLPEGSQLTQRIAYEITEPLKDGEGVLQWVSGALAGKEVTKFTLADVKQGKLQYTAPEENSLTSPIPREGRAVFFTFVARDASTSDGRGDLPPEQAFYIRVLSRNQKSPEWTNVKKVIELKCNEGDRVQIPPEELQIQDEDTPLEDLKFRMTLDPKYGTLVRVGQNGNQPVYPNRTELMYNEFREAVFMYDHSGPGISPDTLLLTADDGKHTASIRVNVEIIPKDVEPPQLVGGSKVVEMFEGESRDISAREHILYSDNDSGPEQIKMDILEITDQGDFIKSDPISGIKRVLRPGDVFFQSDVDEGKLKFTAPDEIGKERITDLIIYDVSDREGNILPREEFTVIIYPRDNQPPSVVPGNATVNEGQCVDLHPSSITVTDVDTPSDNLNFIIQRPPTFGRVETKDKPGEPVTTFSVNTFNKGMIRYCNSVHQGIEPEMDDFLFYVTDPNQPSEVVPYNITIILVDDEPPSLYTQTLKVPEGGTKPITNETLNARDLDTPPDELVYRIRKPPIHGVVNGPDGNPIGDRPFTHQDVIDGGISYTHDGSEAPHDEVVLVLTGAEKEIPGTLPIDVQPEDDEAPQLIRNRPTQVDRNSAVPIDNKKLLAEDEDSPNEDIKFTITEDVPIGELLLIQPDTGEGTPLKPNTPNDHFFQKDIDQGRLRFQHDIETLPINSGSFAFDLSDPQGNTNPGHRHIIYVQQDRFPPRIIVNRRLTVREGGAAPITRNFLRSTDQDSPDERLLYTIVNPVEPSFGHIEFRGAPGVPVREWQQKDIDDNRLVYNHTSDKEAVEDSFIFQVSDGTHSTEGRFIISISPVDDQRPKCKVQILRLRQGERKPITRIEMIATDEDTSDANLIFYVVSQVDHGRLLIRDPQGQFADARSFTMLDVREGRLFYQHDNTKTTTDRFHFQLRDQSHSNVFIMIRPNGVEELVSEPQPFLIEIEPEINRPPTVAVNVPLQFLTRPPDQPRADPAGVISLHELRAHDPDTPDRELIYRVVIPPRHGRVELATSPGRPITQFTQDDVNRGIVRYVLTNLDTPETSDDFTFELQDNADPPNVLSREKFTIYWSWINFVASEYQVEENAGVVRLLIEKTGNLNVYSFVECTTAEGSASSNDFQAKAERIKFEEGATRKTCTVAIRDDRVYEGPEEFYVLLARPLYALLREPKRARVVITDEEDSGCVEFEQPMYYVKETIKVARIPMIRTGDVQEPASVICYTRGDTAKGTDDPYKSYKADFVTRSESKKSRIVFRAGQAKAYCDVPIIDDGIPEGQEDFFLILGKPSDNTRLCANSKAKIIIQGPNDAATIRFLNPRPVVQETDGIIQVELIREGTDLKSPTEVMCSAGHNDPISAEQHNDFVASQQRILFQPGQKSAICSVRLNDDHKFENNETFKVVLTQPVGAALGPPSTSIVTIIDDDLISPTVQFAEGKTVVNEQQDIVDVPIVRRGSLDRESTVVCYTLSKTAIGGQDFKERRRSESSRIYFAPGEDRKMCTVHILDDLVFEPDETFWVVLADARNTQIGLQSKSQIVITNAEDYPQVYFKPTEYSVPEPVEKGTLSSIILTVHRRGDLQQESKVRVTTRDGTAIAGQDYNPRSHVLEFRPGESVKEFYVEILKDYEMEGPETFSVTLGPDQPINAHFGLETKATVTIMDQYVRPQPAPMPSPPLIVSLLFYDDIDAGLRQHPPAGYPIVCVTPCDPQHPNYRPSANCPAPDSVRFRWEMAIDTDAAGNRVYHRLQDDTPFTSTSSRVLDSVYFAPNVILRCGVTYVTGQTRFSADITISRKGVCERPRTPETKGHQEPWRATIEYTGGSNGEFSNRVHISVSIPHRDGIMPVISTFPVHNLNLILSDASYRSSHVCSNLVLNQQLDSQGFLDAYQPIPTDSSSLARVYDVNLRGNMTILFYRHLDIGTCQWRFDAYYDISTLVEECGGTVQTRSKLGQYGQRQITVSVPLYISYVYSVPPNNWGSIDHRTTLDVEIGYDTSLWHDRVQTGVTQEPIDATLQVTRLRQLENGSLEITFRTQAKFRGIFVMRHPGLSNTVSRVTAPSNLPLRFSLEIVWQQDTYERPSQIWRAISDYSLSDYTGDYMVDLIPCVAILNEVYDGSPDSLSCEPRDAKQFSIPINFQQSPRPEPANFFLNTEFRLDHDDRVFDNSVADAPVLADDNQVDSKSVFNKGDVVHGCVAWNPSQDISGPFTLQIQRLYVCSGNNNFVPQYDPTGERYSKGPQLGCIVPNEQISNAFMVLNREDPSVTRSTINGESFDAKFLDDDPKHYVKVKGKPGVDGFTFKTNPLYGVKSKDASQRKWYIQVIYLISLTNPDGSTIRHKRSAMSAIGDSHKEAGSNIKKLLLADENGNVPGLTGSHRGFFSLNPMTIGIISGLIALILLVTIVLIVIRSKRSARYQGYTAAAYTRRPGSSMPGSASYSSAMPLDVRVRPAYSMAAGGRAYAAGTVTRGTEI